MFTNFALLCPGAILLVWSLVFLCKKKDSAYKWIPLALCVLCAMHFGAEGIILSQQADTTTMACLNIVKQVVGPMKLPVLIIYYRMLSGKKPIGWDFIVWFMTIVAHSAVVITLTVLIGLHNAGHLFTDLVAGSSSAMPAGKETEFFRYICTDGYNAILLLQLAFVAYSAIVAVNRNRYGWTEIKKVWNGQSARIQAVTLPTTIMLVAASALRRVAGDAFLCEHPAVSALFSIAIAIIVHIIAYVCNMSHTDPDDIADLMGDKLTEADINMVEATNEQKKMIVANFLHEMDDNKVYLDSSLTIESLAQLIGTNRTYISRMIKIRYNQNFREYINRRRIKYAQEFMLHNPHALLEYVASECGYMSTSAFSKNFQLYVGMSPRLWVNNQKLMAENNNS